MPFPQSSGRRGSDDGIPEYGEYAVDDVPACGNWLFRPKKGADRQHCEKRTG